jgi:hypothetical protein
MQLVTTILNVYKRPEYLHTQYNAIEQQTVDSDIWIDYTVPAGEQMFDLSDIAPKAKTTIRTNQNLYHIGRFFYALNAPTEYVFICDDDIIPGKNYLQHCIDTIDKVGDCIVTSYGLRLDSKVEKYQSTGIYGWRNLPSALNEPTEVDMGGHSWFLKKKNLNLITREEPINYTNGEDLHFSYLINKYSDLPLIVPTINKDDPDNWSCDFNQGMNMGNDKHATFKNKDHNSIRDQIVKHQLNNGWKLYSDRK